jgi:ClpP class serine protease
MSLSELFWLFFIFAALQPMIRQRLLVLMRKRKIAEIQSKRGTRVIVLVHRQETMRLLGFPIVRYIDMDDSEEVIRAVQETDPETPIDVVLHTPGGLVLAALQIARALDSHPAKVTVLVPHLAMSGGTLIAMAADEIVISPHAVLGPIDPQIGGFPAASLAKVVADKPIAEIDDQTLILADVGRKATAQVKRAAQELLADPLGEARAAEVAEKMTGGTWTHDYAITPEEAKALGLPVSTAMPEEVLQLLSLYPQPVRSFPTVEYLPVPPRPPARDGR